MDADATLAFSAALIRAAKPMSSEVPQRFPKT